MTTLTCEANLSAAEGRKSCNSSSSITPFWELLILSHSWSKASLSTAAASSQVSDLPAVPERGRPDDGWDECLVQESNKALGTM